MELFPRGFPTCPCRKKNLLGLHKPLQIDESMLPTAEKGEKSMEDGAVS